MKTILSNKHIRDILSQSDLDHYTDRLVKNKAALDVIAKSLSDNTTEKNFSQYKRLIKATKEADEKEAKKDKEIREEMGKESKTITELEEGRLSAENIEARDREARVLANKKRTKKDEAEKRDHAVLEDWQELAPKLEAFSEAQGKGRLIKIYEGIIDNVNFKGSRENASEGVIKALYHLINDNLISSQLGAVLEEGKRTYTKRTYKTEKGIRVPKEVEKIDIGELETRIRKACEVKVNWNKEINQKDAKRYTALFGKLQNKQSELEDLIGEIKESEYKPNIGDKETWEKNKKERVEELDKEYLNINGELAELEEKITTIGEDVEEEVPIMNHSIRNIPLLALIHEHIFKHLPKMYLKKHSTTVKTKRTVMGEDGTISEEEVDKEVKTLEEEMRRLRRAIMSSTEVIPPKEGKLKPEEDKKLDMDLDFGLTGFSQTIQEIDEINDIITSLEEERKQIGESFNELVRDYRVAAKTLGEQAEEASKVIDEEMAEHEKDKETYTKLSDELVRANKDIPNSERLRWYKGALKTIKEGAGSSSKVKIREGSSKEKEIQSAIKEITEQLEGMDAIAEEAEESLTTVSGATKEEVQQQMTEYRQAISRAKKPETIQDLKEKNEAWNEESKMLSLQRKGFERKHSKSPEQFLSEYDRLSDKHNERLDSLVATDLKELMKETIDREKALEHKKKRIEANLFLADEEQRKAEVKKYNAEVNKLKREAKKTIKNKIDHLIDVKKQMEKFEDEGGSIATRNKKLRAHVFPKEGEEPKKELGSTEIIEAVESMNSIQDEINTTFKQLDRLMKKPADETGALQRFLDTFKTSTSATRLEENPVLVKLSHGSRAFLEEVEENILDIDSPKDKRHLNRLLKKYRNLLIKYQNEGKKIDSI